jgi:deoxyribose-phosphate aldolase
MASKWVVSARVLEGLRPGDTFEVPKGAVITPLALDVARERGIRLVPGGEARPVSTGLPPGSKIAIGADHAGFRLKEALRAHLESLGYPVLDLGTGGEEAVDYPDFARAVAEAVVRGECAAGVVADGAGVGAAIAANKVPGALAAPCADVATARNAREHNFANVLCLPARRIGEGEAKEILLAFLRTPKGEERHARRVEKIASIERAYAQPAEGSCDCGTHCATRCPDPLERLVAFGADRIGVHHASPPSAAEIAAAIDHTLLKPDATYAEIDRLCAEAREFGFATVCVNPTHVARCARNLQGSSVLVCTVVGFPLGASLPETKAFEARRALHEGACEIDMVMNVGALKSGDDALVRRDISAVAAACREGNAALKVILETAYLTDEEKERACRLAKEAGAHYVKTSTGFGPGGATADDVALMRRAVGSALGVKAAGGIRDLPAALEMIRSGANRIGASAGVKIVSEASGEAPAPEPARAAY